MVFIGSVHKDHWEILYLKKDIGIKILATNQKKFHQDYFRV